MDERRTYMSRARSSNPNRGHGRRKRRRKRLRFSEFVGDGGPVKNGKARGRWWWWWSELLVSPSLNEYRFNVVSTTRRKYVPKHFRQIRIIFPLDSYTRDYKQHAGNNRARTTVTSKYARTIGFVHIIRRSFSNFRFTPIFLSRVVDLSTFIIRDG